MVLVKRRCFTCGDWTLWAKILHAVIDPSLLPFSLVLFTKSQNCLIVFTSSSLFEGFVALNRSVSRVTDWFTLDLDGELKGDEWTGEATKTC